MADLLTLTQPLTGCLVSAQGTPDMTASVAVGSVLVNNAAVTVAAGNVTITAADAAGDRIDAVVADSTGAKSVIAGAVNDGANAQPPDTTGYALLAYVTVLNQGSPSYTGTIIAAAISDQRVFALVHTSPYRVSGLWYGVAGAGGVGSTVWTNNDMWLLPFFTGKAFAISHIGLRPRTAGTAGTTGRLGIYSDDGDGTLALLVDAGSVALDVSNTDETLATSQTLGPGWWWLAIALQNVGVTPPQLYTATPVGGTSPIGNPTLLGASGGNYGNMKSAGVSGALPTTPASLVYSPGGAPAVFLQAA